MTFVLFPKSFFHLAEQILLIGHFFFRFHLGLMDAHIFLLKTYVIDLWGLQTTLVYSVSSHHPASDSTSRNHYISDGFISHPFPVSNCKCILFFSREVSYSSTGRCAKIWTSQPHCSLSVCYIG